MALALMLMLAMLVLATTLVVTTLVVMSTWLLTKAFPKHEVRSYLGESYQHWTRARLALPVAVVLTAVVLLLVAGVLAGLWTRMEEVTVVIVELTLLMVAWLKATWMVAALVMVAALMAVTMTTHTAVTTALLIVAALVAVTMVTHTAVTAALLMVTAPMAVTVAKGRRVPGAYWRQAMFAGQRTTPPRRPRRAAAWTSECQPSHNSL